MSELPERLDLASMDIADERCQALLELLPEVRTEDGKIDFDRLKLALGEAVDVGRERYGMTWPGKAECFKTIQAPSLATLRPCPEESVNFDTTENLIIEGDNLEVLKLLQKSYLGKVKMIYIDPPYNTGNDFIYPDNFSESLQTYLEYTGQVDSDGRKFGTNTEADGRFHSNWLNMMYPRLTLARNLLRPDGLIACSIGQTELANLISLMNLIFGEENVISTVSRVAKTTSNKGTYFAPSVDFVVIAGKGTEALQPFSLPPGEDYERGFRGIDPDGRRYKPVGLYQASLDPLRGCVNQRYWIECPDGSLAIPPGSHFPEPVAGRNLPPIDGTDKVWRWSWQTQKARANELVFKETRSSPLVNEELKPSKWNVYVKQYLDRRLEEGVLPRDFLPEFTNDKGTAALKDLGLAEDFDFAKPVELVQWAMALSDDMSGIVLDFFAGSGTTAHAVLEANSRSGGQRRFILVQLPEPSGRDALPTIADITKERVRRVIKKLDEADSGKLKIDGAARQDRGFRVFKLAESNFTPWDAGAADGVDALTSQLELHIDHTREGRTQGDLLYELLLKSGFPLTAKVEMLSVGGQSVYSVAGGALLVCLEKELNLELIREMAKLQPERVLCLDEGFAGNDQLKTNAVLTFRDAGVTAFKTV